MAKMEIWDSAAFIVTAVGALNWGLQSFFNYNVVTALIPQYADWAYKIIGVAGAYALITYFKLIKR